MLSLKNLKKYQKKLFINCLRYAKSHSLKKVQEIWKEWIKLKSWTSKRPDCYKFYRDNIIKLISDEKAGDEERITPDDLFIIKFASLTKFIPKKSSNTFFKSNLCKDKINNNDLKKKAIYLEARPFVQPKFFLNDAFLKILLVLEDIIGGKMHDFWKFMFKDLRDNEIEHAFKDFILWLRKYQD